MNLSKHRINFPSRQYILVDACEAEEKVMEGLFAVGMNQHKELSAFAMLGEISLNRDQVLQLLIASLLIVRLLVPLM
jgi:exosome complex RNA-binding protein Rrp42 (RNase PH superfamily)